MYALIYSVVDQSSNVTTDSRAFYDQRIGPLLDKVDELTSGGVTYDYNVFKKVNEEGQIREVWIDEKNDLYEVTVVIHKVVLSEEMVEFDLFG